MEKFIRQENINHYRELLAAKLDEARRHQILRLLAAEEARLAEIEKSESSQATRRSPALRGYLGPTA
jgi:hypothetical protein